MALRGGGKEERRKRGELNSDPPVVPPCEWRREAQRRTDDGACRGPDLVGDHRHEGVLAPDLLPVRRVVGRGERRGVVHAGGVLAGEVVERDEEAPEAQDDEDAGCGAAARRRGSTGGRRGAAESPRCGADAELL